MSAAPDGFREPAPDDSHGPTPDDSHGPTPDDSHGPTPDGFREPALDDSRGPALADSHELFGAQETFAGRIETDDELADVRQRFEQTTDRQARGELAEQALDYVDRQLALAREQRRALDGVEGTLWARRNRLEQFLIDARGIDWWHARRNQSQPDAAHPDTAR